MNLPYLLTFVCFFYTANSLDQLSDEFINFLNQENLSWKAGRNFDPSITFSDFQDMFGEQVIDDIESTLDIKRLSDNIGDSQIPKQFDARTQWPKCSSIGLVRDQSNCLSWAVGAVGAMSDRVCIHSDQKVHHMVSGSDLMGCCGKVCGNCSQGSVAAAWEFWHSDGIVTGGLFADTEGCQYYALPPCDHTGHLRWGKCENFNTLDYPPCKHKCDDHTIDYQKQKIYGEKPYRVGKSEKDMQLEIMKNGPVQAIFDIYTDFLHYKSGVYQKHKNATFIGSHTVKIIGWNVEEISNISYWLIVNSFNEDWGERGFFKMIRGVNHCGIEENVIGGLPVTENSSNQLAGFKIIFLWVLIGIYWNLK